MRPNAWLKLMIVLSAAVAAAVAAEPRAERKYLPQTLPAGSQEVLASRFCDRLEQALFNIAPGKTFNS